MWVVREKEAGNIIEKVFDEEQGKKLIEKYEEADKEEGTYTEGFYEVVEIDPIIILMENGCTEKEAEKALKRGTIIYANPKEWIQTLKDCDCYDGETIEMARSGKYEDISMVTYAGHEFLIAYVN